MWGVVIVEGIVTLIEAMLGIIELKYILAFLNATEEEKNFSSIIKEFNNCTNVIKN
ncbi:hypothetical protein LCGC14_0709740 [marine sediment metagenome]|uniref:Uncharacterized protein n=1 Tax=marine sediment metagenome TaxID=412755 RepID=A0A0F9T1A6_9ZZZZ